MNQPVAVVAFEQVHQEKHIRLSQARNAVTLKDWINRRFGKYESKPSEPEATEPEQREDDSIFPLFCDGRLLHRHHIEALQHQLSIAIKHSSELECAAEVCCQILCPGAKEGSTVRDLASEIVFHQLDPAIAIEKINSHVEKVNGHLDLQGEFSC